MTDLTPETLAEWRKDAETHSGASPGVMDLRILALLAAHAAEKAAREEAEARADKAEQEREAWRTDWIARVGELERELTRSRAIHKEDFDKLTEKGADRG